MKMLDEYFQLQQQIYEYFGYQEQWQVIPMEDRREMYWWTDEDQSSEVIYAEKVEDFNQSTGNYYHDTIYTQRHHNKWIYKGPEYTMIMVDTHIDGNKFLAIYDNQKELKTYPFE